MQYDTPQPRLTGGIFAYIDDSTIRLVVTDSPFVRIYVHNTTAYWTVASSANLTCDLEVEGAGGLHDDHFPETIDTCYVVYAAWESDTAVDDGTVKLFAVPSGTTVDAALVAALTDGGAPADYDTWSLPIGLMVNDGSGDIVETSYTRDGQFELIQCNYGILILPGGQSTLKPAIDGSAVIPEEASTILYQVSAYNADAGTSKYVQVFDGNGDLIETLRDIGDLAQCWANQRRNFEVDLLGSPTTCLYYDWSAAGTDWGLNVYVKRIKLW